MSDGEPQLAHFPSPEVSWMLRALLNRWLLPPSATPAVAPTPATFVQALGHRAVEHLAHLNRGASRTDRAPLLPDPHYQVFVVCESITSKCSAKNYDADAAVRAGYLHAFNESKNQWFINTGLAHVLMLFFSGALRDEQVHLDPKAFTVFLSIRVGCCTALTSRRALPS